MASAAFDFTGDCYLVTGASSGMGREVALALTKSGATVLAVARREEKLQALQAETAGYAGALVSAACDVCDGESLEGHLAAFTEKYGRLSGTVHAAGIAVFTPVMMYNARKAHNMMETTFWAGMNLLQLATGAGYAREKTSHVLFSSADAICCEKGKFAYAAAKAAVNAGVRAAAKELGPQGHRVNAVLPGWVETEMTVSPMVAAMADQAAIEAREILGTGKPEDVTGMVLFLLSDAARWVTGACLAVDGGYSA